MEGGAASVLWWIGFYTVLLLARDRLTCKYCSSQLAKKNSYGLTMNMHMYMCICIRKYLQLYVHLRPSLMNW